MYNIGFIRTVKKILECVCPTCARYRIHPDDPKYRVLANVRDKFKYAREFAKSKTVCEFCETQLMPVRRQGVVLYYDPKKFDAKAARTPITPADALQLLARITDETCNILGLNPVTSRPEWMITTVLPVPPMCVRPSVSIDSGGRGEDDLTHMLANIIRYNNLLTRNEHPKMLADYREQLQIHLSGYIDNEVSGVAPAQQKGGRLIKSLSTRLKGKNGRLRGNLMGKRVDFSARTVITGDPELSIEEVGVPLSVARTLTFPERVTRYNIDQLQILVNNGTTIYPGARYVVKDSSHLGQKAGGTQQRRIDLGIANVSPTVEIGDVVERQMVTGDLVLFNRQPSLHKFSMMAHTARVMPYSTFRLNVNVCAPYNADFDGDEMNLHMPQSYPAIAELKTLATVSKLLISPQSNKPVNGLVQDSLCGIRQFTQRDTFLTREEVYNLMMCFPEDHDAWAKIPQPVILKPVPLWTGKQIVSLTIPEIELKGVTLTHADREDTFKQLTADLSEPETRWAEAEFYNLTPHDTRVLILNGQLLTGYLSKKTVGTSSGGLVHVIYMDFGPEAARDFLDHVSRIVTRWLLSTGFSVGLGDAWVQPKTVKAVHGLIQTQLDSVTAILGDRTTGPKTYSKAKEAKIVSLLSRARDMAGKAVALGTHPRNNIRQMVEAGSKGSVLNICQISACVGQQIVEGGRIPLGFKNRTLPHFSKFDHSPAARGFVQHSFIEGLTPSEFFYHAMGGREGVIDTAVKTAETGYIQRRLVKALEDVVVKSDGTVRNSRNDILQFYYGEDGFDGTAIEYQTLPTMLLSETELRTRYFNPDCLEEWDILQQDQLYMRNVMRLREARWALPLNLDRFVLRARKKRFSGGASTGVVSTSYVFSKTSSLRTTLHPTPIVVDAAHPPARLFACLLSGVLATRRVVNEYKLNQAQFDWLVL
ncbi:hypothetical protein BJ741DRAFT_644031 [Chytriomyces cf. hyalinus JEL632]|nr:hypothetical protein BJ741DRAFT_644031 [Chytriomyces cf. hyalinus JEL632]